VIAMLGLLGVLFPFASGCVLVDEALAHGR
jgi:hypothetical protein